MTRPSKRYLHPIFCPLLFLFAMSNAESNERPQTPLAPYPYHIDEVRFPGGSPDLIIAGSLTRPITQHALPAVILVHGSGPTDRDSTYENHKPFLVIADALTRAGYIVLRYDKRGVGESTGDFRSADTMDLASDALSALFYLRSRVDVDTQRIAVVGHSEGGSIAALLCASNSPPNSCISINGMIEKFEGQLKLQEVLTGKDVGATEAYEKAINQYYDLVYAALKTEDYAQRLSLMNNISRNWLSLYGSHDKNYIAAQESLLARPKLLASPWFKKLTQLDIERAIKDSAAPFLILTGSTDRQVSSTENLLVAKRAFGVETQLRRAEEMSNINHMGQESESGRSTEYGEISQTVSPLLIRKILGFLSISL